MRIALEGLAASVRRLGTASRQIAILQRAGVIDLRRPGQALTASRVVRRLGPLAGPARMAAIRYPETVAVMDGSMQLTYRELDKTTDAVAWSWIRRGVSANSVIGILCRDHCGMVQAMIAGAKVGAKICLLNTGFGPVQLSDVAAREGITEIVADEEFSGCIAQLPFEVKRLDVTADSVDGVRPLLPDRQGGLVILTGGTTGTPKGVPRKVQSPLTAAQFFDKVPIRHEDVTLLLAPLFHGTAFSQYCLSVAVGCTVVLHGKFDAQRAIEEIDRHRCTSVVLVPTILRRILDLGAEHIGRYDTSRVRIILSAGAALPAVLGTRAIAQFGPVLYNFYGSTETGTATVATPADWIASPGTVGRPPLGVAVRLYDGGGNRVTAPGGRGTVYVGNEMAFSGYSGGGSKAEIDGLMSTGDVGHFDTAGRLFIDGRDDDMIVSGGENVFPGEVEDLLYGHPDISEAAVVGVPDIEYGQRLAAFIVPKGKVTEDSVREYVRKHLARFKIPRDIYLVEELPRTPTGKLDRKKVIGWSERI
ncbi:AMP-binding protein [Nocardia brasiliensis]